MFNFSQKLEMVNFLRKSESTVSIPLIYDLHQTTVNGINKDANKIEWYISEQNFDCNITVTKTMKNSSLNSWTLLFINGSFKFVLKVSHFQDLVKEKQWNFTKKCIVILLFIQALVDLTDLKMAKEFVTWIFQVINSVLTVYLNI